jgi:hypothetical protein
MLGYCPDQQEEGLMNWKGLWVDLKEDAYICLDWLRDKSRLSRKDDLSQTYAGRQFGFWSNGFNQDNMRWINRLHASLCKADSSVRDSEPGIQAMLDRCRDLGLCSETMYKSLTQYGDRENGLPLVLNLK